MAQFKTIPPDYQNFGGDGKNGGLRVREGSNDPMAEIGATSFAHFAPEGGGPPPGGPLPSPFGSLLLYQGDAPYCRVKPGSITFGQHVLIEDAPGAHVYLGAADATAASLKTANSVHLNGEEGAIRAGSGGKDGLVMVRDGTGKEIVRIAGGPSSASSDCTIHIDGREGIIRAGAGGENGLVLLRESAGKEIVRIASGPSTASADCTIHLNGHDGSIRAGSGGTNGLIVVRDKNGAEKVRMDGETGDVVLENADCAEEFDIAPDTDAAPGSVLVIGDDERLVLSTLAYDRRVAGVVSGAGSCRPGIVLGRRPGAIGRPAIALVGKVYCRVDADHGTVHVGDLLVSSPTPGHAMIATDATRTPGAVLGKALRGLPAGKALIPILVSLQ